MNGRATRKIFVTILVFASISDLRVNMKFTFNASNVKMNRRAAATKIFMKKMFRGNCRPSPGIGLGFAPGFREHGESLKPPYDYDTPHVRQAMKI
jgi:hypothetical protein